jgi:hypothetical protein
MPFFFAAWSKFGNFDILHCQMQMTRLFVFSILFLPLFFSLSPSLNFLLALRKYFHDINILTDFQKEKVDLKKKNNCPKLPKL